MMKLLVRFPWRGLWRSVALGSALCLAIPAATAGTQSLEPWKIFYLNGIGAEAQHQYGRALKFFDEARKLQSRPIKDEWFAQYGRHDYDPPYHIARCLVKLGGADPELVEGWIKASRRGGVTPAERLDELLDELHHRQGTPIPTPTPVPPATPNTPTSPVEPPSSAVPQAA